MRCISVAWAICGEGNCPTIPLTFLFECTDYPWQITAGGAVCDLGNESRLVLEKGSVYLTAEDQRILLDTVGDCWLDQLWAQLSYEAQLDRKPGALCGEGWGSESCTVCQEGGV